MISQSVWVGIAIGVFFVGIGISYAIFSNTYNPSTMKFRNQEIFDQMMSQNPKMMANWMVNDPKHVEEMATAMSENHDFMMEMMSVMINDPALRLQMLGHMTENQEAMEMMNNMMGSDGMMTGSMMSDMQFNVDAPITMPMIDGYYNGEKVFFVHTEVSDKNMADMMSMMINFPTLHVSDLTNIPQSEMSKVYVFTNGIPGSGPYGGGPFMFQIDIFDSIPGQDVYSQFRVPHLVTWNDDSIPRILTSENEILEAESNGELTI